jgi:hypothetical protein
MMLAVQLAATRQAKTQNAHAPDGAIASHCTPPQLRTTHATAMHSPGAGKTFVRRDKTLVGANGLAQPLRQSPITQAQKRMHLADCKPGHPIRTCTDDLARHCIGCVA